MSNKQVTLIVVVLGLLLALVRLFRAHKRRTLVLLVQLRRQPGRRTGRDLLAWFGNQLRA